MLQPKQSTKSSKTSKPTGNGNSDPESSASSAAYSRSSTRSPRRQTTAPKRKQTARAARPHPAPGPEDAPRRLRSVSLLPQRAPLRKQRPELNLAAAAGRADDAAM